MLSLPDAASLLDPSFWTGVSVGSILVGLALATLLSEDLACIAGGLLVASGALGFVEATTACALGIAVGDFLLVLAGRGARSMPWLARQVGRRESALARAASFLQAHPVKTLVAVRFVPGSRLPTYLASGVARLPLGLVAVTLVLGSALWTPILVGIASLAGRATLEWLGLYERAWLAILATFAFVLLAKSALRPLLSRRGRRLALGRWHRLSRWEFWPAWLFQIPVVAWFLALAARHRSLTLFTAANPAIPDGGFVLESKAAILGLLEQGGAGAAVARTLHLAAREAVPQRLERVRDFLATEQLDYPVVFKPDVGERGAGVAILLDEATLFARLAHLPADMLLQEYIPGEEFGVFYVRRPGARHGEIFSITEKRLLMLTGDGVRSLGELILDDPRAVSMAPLHFERHRDRLDSIPSHSEIVRLVELGNHCRGALFLDGRHHATEELRAALDRLLERVEGFHFGRFDLRVPSIEHLRAGRDLRILELNGVASEATHIYHPGASLLAAYATLFRQWHLAFAIARENVERGAQPASLTEMIRRIRAWRRGETTI